MDYLLTCNISRSKEMISIARMSKKKKKKMRLKAPMVKITYITIIKGKQIKVNLSYNTRNLTI